MELINLILGVVWFVLMCCCCTLVTPKNHYTVHELCNFLECAFWGMTSWNEGYVNVFKDISRYNLLHWKISNCCKIIWAWQWYCKGNELYTDYDWLQASTSKEKIFHWKISFICWYFFVTFYTLNYTSTLSEL